MSIKPLRNLPVVFVSLFAALAVSVASAQEIPWASSAEDVGMSSERLERINPYSLRHPRNEIGLVRYGFIGFLIRALTVGIGRTTHQRASSEKHD